MTDIDMKLLDEKCRVEKSVPRANCSAGSDQAWPFTSPTRPRFTLEHMGSFDTQEISGTKPEREGKQG